jgi:tRNA threonylcarbamoyladenosine biosynthesis protein TsaB
MAILLNIDTALETASVCLSDNSKSIALSINENQKDHAAWLHPAIRKVLHDQGLHVGDLAAIAISIGPGSYTGLRIGLSAAKGLCYALNIPLIAVGTLEMIAHGVREIDTDFICPMIDARRMEVYAAVYNKSLQEIVRPAAINLNENSFFNLLLTHKIAFCGSGHNKLQTILCHDNAIFIDSRATAADLAQLAFKNWENKSFASIAYTEPFYIKEFFTQHQ